MVKGKKDKKDSPKLAAMRAAREAKYTKPVRAKVPFNERWPGKFSIQAVIYTPEGTRVDIETSMSDEAGKMVLDALSREAAEGK